MKLNRNCGKLGSIIYIETLVFNFVEMWEGRENIFRRKSRIIFGMRTSHVFNFEQMTMTIIIKSSPNLHSDKKKIL